MEQVASRAIEDATCLDYVAPAFVVVQSSGKRRVVMDFDKLNKETLTIAFRYETLKSLRHLAKRGDWAISFDLEDGFHAKHSHSPGRQEVLHFFHRWESISVRGPSLRLATKHFCVHQGDAPSGVFFVPTMAWVCLRRQSVDYHECPGGGRKWRIQEM
jgi:hypothetical protein